MVETIRTDVLVVGGGGAAARAAIEADMEGAEVILATKGRFGAIGVRGGGATGISISEATGASGFGRVGNRGILHEVPHAAAQIEGVDSLRLDCVDDIVRVSQVEGNWDRCRGSKLTIPI